MANYTSLLIISGDNQGWCICEITNVLHTAASYRRYDHIMTKFNIVRSQIPLNIINSPNSISLKTLTIWISVIHWPKIAAWMAIQSSSETASEFGSHFRSHIRSRLGAIVIQLKFQNGIPNDFPNGFRKPIRKGYLYQLLTISTDFEFWKLFRKPFRKPFRQLIEVYT